MSDGDDDEATEMHTAWEHRFDVLHARLAAARDGDDGSSTARWAHIDAVIALIVAFADELDDARADTELAALSPLVAHDPLLEIEARRKLAKQLTSINDRDRVVAQLEAARALARVHGFADIEADLATRLGDTPRPIRPPQRESYKNNPEVAAHFELSQASITEGEVAEAHCLAAVEHARRANDAALLHEASVALAERLARRAALVEAEELLESLPPLDDALETRALLEEIWRRLGSHLVDEPDEPDEPSEMDRQLRAYITKPRNVPQSLVDGGLVSPDRVREWSHGELREAADLESQRIFGPVRAFWCACGRYRGRAYAGIVCKRCGVEVVHSSTRRARAGHITLPVAVVHPWYLPAAATLLGKSAPELERQPVDELRSALSELDLEWLADDVKREIVTAPKAKIADQAGRRLALIEAFRTARTQAYTRPEHVILEIIPVVPPHGDIGCDRAKVRDAYAELLAASPSEASGAVGRLFAAFAAR